MEQLTAEFIDSLSGRLKSLEAIQADAQGGEIQSIAHKLGGSAGSYGFRILGEAAGALDDWLAHSRDTLAIQVYSQLLCDMLRESLRAKKDPIHFRKDDRFRKLISEAESTV